MEKSVSPVKTKRFESRVAKKDLKKKVQMKRPPVKGSAITEWWLLKYYFESSDKKFLFKMRDEFQ